MRTRFFILNGALWLWSVLFSGCQVTRYVPQGSYLLESQPTFRGNKNFPASVLSEQISLQPNTRILGMRLPLHLYNLGRFLSESRLLQKRIPKLSYYGLSAARFLQTRLGEPPVVIRRKTLEEDALTLERFYRLEGYLDARVQPIVRPSPLFAKRAAVIYGISEGLPWHIGEITFRLQDTLLKGWVENIRPFLPIKVGMRLRAEDLDRTRRFIYEQLQESGYPEAKLGDIYFEIDTFQWITRVEPLMKFFFIRTQRQKKFYHTCKLEIYINGYYTPHTVEKVRVRMHVGDEVHDQREIREFPLESQKSVAFRRVPVFIESSKQARAILHPDVLGRRVAAILGRTYASHNISSTLRMIRQLSAVRSVQAQPILDSLGQLEILYDVELDPPISVQVGVEGFQITDRFFNTSLPGFNLAFTLRQQSLFARGWNFFLRGIGGVSYYRGSSTAPLVPLYNIQLQSALQIPSSKPLLSTLYLQRPRFIRHQVQVNLQSLRRIEFDRNFLTWDVQKLIQSPDDKSEITLTWLSLIYVQSRISAAFSEQISRLPLNIQALVLRDFFPRLYAINGVRYTASTNYFTNEPGRGLYMGFQFDTNLLYALLAHELRRQGVSYLQPSGADTVLAWYRFFINLRFARRYKVGSGLYIRLFAGIASLMYPDSSSFVPYEIRFFAGGPNSMRGWQIGALGTADSILSGSLFAFGAEKLIEQNIEFRQRIYKFFHGATFMDLGIVENRTRAGVHAGVAISGGVGIRLDWGFSVIRLDIGQQLYRPDLRQWLFPPKKYWGGSYAQYHIAIGYPF